MALCAQHADTDPLGIGCIMMEGHLGAHKLETLPPDQMAMVILARRIVTNSDGVYTGAELKPIAHAWLRLAYPYLDPVP